MITINAINNNGSFEPETLPNTTFGSHFDGVSFFFFESKKEAENFYNELDSQIIEINE
jgi:glycine cleavage system H lipoate-binding protein